MYTCMLTLCLQSQQPLSPPMMVPSQLSPGPNQPVQGMYVHIVYLHVHVLHNLYTNVYIYMYMYLIVHVSDWLHTNILHVHTDLKNTR